MSRSTAYLGACGIRRSATTRFLLLLPILFGLAAHADVPVLTDIGPNGGYVKNIGGSKVIVFVHGLFSDPEAWRCDPAHYWPTMIGNDPDQTFSNTDIYVVGYPTPRSHGTMTMADLESNILSRMQADGVFSRHREVIFVAHSMGGLLTQQMLLTYRDKELFKKVRAIFLYGTPQEGSKLANWAKYFNPDPKLKELQAGDKNFTLQEMDQDWTHAGFTEIKRYCAYETKPEEGFKVVDRYSATRGCNDSVAMNENHRELVKPCDTEADSYIFLKSELKSTSDPFEVPSQVAVSTQRTQSHQSTPYDEVGKAQERIRDLDNEWQNALLRISQDFMRPYKYGLRPIPTVLPDGLRDQLSSTDQDFTFRYRSFLPELFRTTQDALECMTLTPNQMIEEKAHFNSANSIATQSTPIPQIETNSANRNRFSAMTDYLIGLKRKVGDTRCGME